MALTAVATQAGTQAILRTKVQANANLSTVLLIADDDIKELIGSTNYTSLLAQTLTAIQARACLRAANLFAASHYYEESAPPVTDRGVLVNTQTGGVTTDTLADGKEVKRQAVRWQNEAIRLLRRAGLYQRPSTTVLNRYDVDADDD